MTTLSSKDLNYKDVKILRDKGLGMRKIADIYNCNSGTVWYFCVNNNLHKPSGKKQKNLIDYIHEIRECLESGLCIEHTAKKLGLSTNGVKNFAVRHKIPFIKTKRDFPEDQMQNIIDDYYAGINIRQLGKKYNITDTCIYTRFVQLGIDTSKYTRKYSVNTHFFDKIETETQAYVLGWYMSDGCVSKEGHMRIQIHEQDREILYKIRDLMEYTGPIKEISARNNSKPQVLLSITNKELGDKLITLGCTPAKSLTLEFPTCVPYHLIWHFIRGYFDGDGSFNKTGTYAGITSNDLFNKQLQSILTQHGIYSKYYYKNVNKSTCSLFISRKADMAKFVPLLYKDATVFLERKRRKIDHLLAKGV